MKDFFSEIVECLQRRDPVVLATIVSSDGSSPLPTGAMMLVKSGDAGIVGSVGGGLLEALVIEEAKKYFEGVRQPHIGRFDLNGDVSNEGMICGGNVDVLLEPIVSQDLTTFNALLKLRNDGSDAILLRTLDNSGNVQRFLFSSKQESLPEALRIFGGTELDKMKEILHRSFGQEDVRRFKTDVGEIIIQPIKGVPNLVIFGGGHVSKYLAQVASVAGFSTTVIDDRDEFADPERFPGAARVFATEYEHAFAKIEVKPSSYIVIVTRGHSSDEQVLEKAVRTHAKYIGMIGSKRKVIATFENLALKGVPLDDLRRVHAPIGLDIGAITAEEIGVSIVSELIRVRRQFTGPSLSISDHVADWFDKKRSLA